MSTETTISAPPTGDGLVRTYSDVAGVALGAGLRPCDPSPNWWRGRRVRVHCWPNMAFQVAVYAEDRDGEHAWPAIYDYETPADVIAYAIRRAQGR